ncbi:DUF3048 domain-containing protein [Spongisporangium articulatum]|uniref:DUF3048 domain-containing protein n=1 Tax=Spongisporangium articulatum TaxID=3362603 RepID=A0ABW8AUA4_9ACTN
MLRAGRRPGRVLAIGAAVGVWLVVTVAALAACTGPSTPPLGGDGPAAGGRATTTTQSPFTGQPVAFDRPVLAVKVDNSPAARPQRNLDQADLVYVERVEGGLSRYLAVYSSRIPAEVGPVRSARESDLELLRQFGTPALAFSGANSGVLALVKQAPVKDVSPSVARSAYFRGSDHRAPHNLYARGSALLKAVTGVSPAGDIGFRFGDAPGGGVEKASYTVRYPAARFTFTWSAARERWLVSVDGRKATTSSGSRLAAATVVVQRTVIRQSQFHDVLGNNSPYTETVGQGKATVLRGGQAFTGTWARGTAAGGTTFRTDAGAALTFARGQVWLLYLPA